VLRKEFCGNSEVPPLSTPCEKIASFLNLLSLSFAGEIREGEQA
jgi:hypothetical protein